MLDENKKMKCFLDMIINENAKINGYNFNRFGLNFQFECFATLNNESIILKITESENLIELSINGTGIDIKEILLENYNEILKENKIIKNNPVIFKSLKSDEIDDTIFDSTDSLIISMVLNNVNNYFNLKYFNFKKEIREFGIKKLNNDQLLEIYDLIEGKYFKFSENEKTFVIKLLSEYKENESFKDLKNLLQLNYNI